MYEQSAKWNSLYIEPDPKRRRQMLEELIVSEEDDGANEYRRRLINVRHGQDGRREMDLYLFQFINLVQLYRSAKLFRKNARKEILKLVRDLHWDEASMYGEAGERALYWEIRNAAMRYLKTCEGTNFNRGLFGLTASSEGGRQERICRDFWQMTEGLAERTGLQSELRIWIRAALDAYCQADANAQERLSAYRK